MSAMIHRLPTHTAGHGRSPGDAATSRGWSSLTLFPISFVAAFVIGEDQAEDRASTVSPQRSLTSRKAS
jgi:hypothetical protein